MNFLFTKEMNVILWLLKAIIKRTWIFNSKLFLK